MLVLELYARRSCRGRPWTMPSLLAVGSGMLTPHRALRIRSGQLRLQGALRMELRVAHQRAVVACRPVLRRAVSPPVERILYNCERGRIYLRYKSNTVVEKMFSQTKRTSVARGSDSIHNRFSPSDVSDDRVHFSLAGHAVLDASPHYERIGVHGQQLPRPEHERRSLLLSKSPHALPLAAPCAAPQA